MRKNARTTEPATTPETPTVELAKIHDHPANPRINAVADDELVESIRVQGVNDPLMVAPRPDGEWDLIDGHRRKDGALRAGLTIVPINPRYDLVTDAQKIEVMVVTGLQKALLTPVEEAAGYAQLELLGMDDAAIASATGFSVRRVKDRMKLNRLSDDVRGKVHAGDATLVDVAALEEFADDTDATAALEEALGTDNFQHTVFTVRGRRDRAAHKAELIAEFEAAGAVVATKIPGGGGVMVDDTERTASGMHSFPEDLRTPESHDGCLAYVVAEWEYGDPYLVCIDRGRHPAPATTPSSAPTVSEWEKQQAARAERRARQETAAAVRVAWLRDHFTALFPARSHGDLAKAAAAGLPLLIVNERETVDSATLLAALGIDLGPDKKGSAAEEASALRATASTLTGTKPTQVLAQFASYIAALVADQLAIDEAELLDDLDEVQYLLGLWDWMKTAGYPLSDVDIADRTALEVRHTELITEVEAAAS